MKETPFEEALRRFPWAYPPYSDSEDAVRIKENKKPRDWNPTREKAIKQVLDERNSFC